MKAKNFAKVFPQRITFYKYGTCRFTRQSLSRFNFLQKIVREELVSVISQHKTQESKEDIGIIVKLSSICQIVSYSVSCQFSRKPCLHELNFKL